MSTQNEIEEVKKALECVMSDFKKSLNKSELEFLNDRIKHLEVDVLERREKLAHEFRSNMSTLDAKRRNSSSRHMANVFNRAEESLKKEYLQGIRYLESTQKKTIDNMKATLSK